MVSLGTPRPAEWMDFANCAGLPTRMWFPFDSEDGLERHGQHRANNVLAREAKALCGACVVREECLEYALDGRIDHGIFGALDEIERRQYRRKRARIA